MSHTPKFPDSEEVSFHGIRCVVLESIEMLDGRKMLYRLSAPDGKTFEAFETELTEIVTREATFKKARELQDQRMKLVAEIGVLMDPIYQDFWARLQACTHYRHVHRMQEELDEWPLGEHRSAAVTNIMETYSKGKLQ